MSIEKLALFYTLTLLCTSRSSINPSFHPLCLKEPYIFIVYLLHPALYYGTYLVHLRISLLLVLLSRSADLFLMIHDRCGITPSAWALQTVSIPSSKEINISVAMLHTKCLHRRRPAHNWRIALEPLLEAAA